MTPRHFRILCEQRSDRVTVLVDEALEAIGRNEIPRARVLHTQALEALDQTKFLAGQCAEVDSPSGDERFVASAYVQRAYSAIWALRRSLNVLGMAVTA